MTTSQSSASHRTQPRTRSSQRRSPTTPASRASPKPSLVVVAADRVREVVAMGTSYGQTVTASVASSGGSEMPAIPRDHWVPDKAVSHCYNDATCGAEFTLMVRRHHCRCCGNVFCHKCCNMRLLLDTKTAMPTAHVDGGVEVGTTRRAAPSTKKTRASPKPPAVANRV